MLSKADVLSRDPDLSEPQATVEPECPFIVSQDVYDKLQVAIRLRESKRVGCQQPADTPSAHVWA
jgi:hypothetical protein